MTQGQYKPKFNDQCLSQNQRREKMIFLRACLKWCQERPFVENCALWIPYGTARLADLGALGTIVDSNAFSQVPEAYVARKPKHAVIAL